MAVDAGDAAEAVAESFGLDDFWDTELTSTGSLAQIGLADGATLGFTKTTTSSGGATYTAQVAPAPPPWPIPAAATRSP